MKWRRDGRIARFVGAFGMVAACSFDLAGVAVYADADGSAPAASPTLDAPADQGAELEAGPSLDAALGADVSFDARVHIGLDATGKLDAREATTALSLRYNVNGAAFVSTSAQAAGVWLADPGAGGICGPSENSVTAVFGTADGPLYVGEVFGDPLVCNIGVGALQPGSYDVTLHFAEIYFGPGCPGGGSGTGARVFDVQLEGAKVETNLDLFAIGKCIAASSGTGSPVIRKHRVVINDGTLNISMSASVDNAKISAIQLDGPL